MITISQDNLLFVQRVRCRQNDTIHVFPRNCPGQRREHRHAHRDDPVVPGLLVLTPEVNKPTPAVGQRVTRPDSRPHVLGKTPNIDDTSFAGMLHTKILRSEYAHARILSVDVSEAEKMPGVVATLTGREIPVNTFGPSYQDQPLVADDKVRHMGDGVAAVAAETEQQALEALAKISSSSRSTSRPSPTSPRSSEVSTPSSVT